MKRQNGLWTKAICVLLLTCLSACGGGGGGNSTTPTTVTPPAEPPTTPTEPPTEPPAPPAAPMRISNTTCLAPATANLNDGGLRVERAFAQLPQIPRLVALQQAPQSTQFWYALSQYGHIFAFSNDDNADALTVFLDLEEQVYSASNEAGLLGMAFHPDYADNGWVFVYYMPSRDSARLSRFTRNGAGNGLNPNSEKIILEVSQPAPNHNGGGLGFGPDGYLYLSLGDGGAANDLFGQGQDTSTLLATMLRLDIDVADDTTPYEIPSDNPFADGMSGRPEIYAYGLRNPWRWSFDSLTGDLWVGDVGQNAREEIDIITAGGNYGWPITEGNACLFGDDCETDGLISPVVDYLHSETGGCSVTGGYVYRGSQINSLQGNYVFGDFCNGSLYSVESDGSNTSAIEQLDTALSISAFAQDENGELYVLNHSGEAGGGIYRLTSGDSQNEGSAIPALLSQTGCFSDTASMAPAMGVIPYPISSQLWSDGADKERLFAIPDDTVIALSPDGDFEFPDRSVLVKSFFHDGSPVETRLFMKHDNGWAGYSYAWNTQRSDATLITEGMSVAIDESYTHIFPSRSDCLTCHLPASGYSLGLETLQQNRDFPADENLPDNYLQQLTTLGYFSESPSTSLLDVRLQSLDETDASLTERARSYLHSNCAGCHRPGGSLSNIDLRYGTSLADMNICAIAPQYGDLGIEGAALLAPGNSASSVLLERMLTLDDNRMPPLSTAVVHTQATETISAWIDSLAGCDSPAD